MTTARMTTSKARFQRLTTAPKRAIQSDASEHYVPGLFGPITPPTPAQEVAVTRLLARRGAADLAAMLGVGEAIA